MMTKQEITNRFPDLAVGEVIYICSNGVVFNQGTEKERSKFARRYCEDMKFVAPEKVVGIALETEEIVEDLDVIEIESPEPKTKATTKRKNSKNN